MVGTGGWMRRGERGEGWEGAGSRALEGGTTLRGQGQGDATMGTKSGRRGDIGCTEPQQQIQSFRGYLFHSSPLLTLSHCCACLPLVQEPGGARAALLPAIPRRRGQGEARKLGTIRMRQATTPCMCTTMQRSTRNASRVMVVSVNGLSMKRCFTDLSVRLLRLPCQPGAAYQVEEFSCTVSKIQRFRVSDHGCGAGMRFQDVHFLK